MTDSAARMKIETLTARLDYQEKQMVALKRQFEELCEHLNVEVVSIPAKVEVKQKEKV
jgi:hypothetical protein